MHKVLWIMPNKSNRNSGIFKYNNELIKIKKKKTNLNVIYTGNNKLYFVTFFCKFIILPIYLIFNSFKFNTLILPEEGYAFLKLFSFTKKNVIIIHDYRKNFVLYNKVKIKENFKQFYLNLNFLFINSYDSIIVPSKFTKNQITKYVSINPKKIKIIPNIINFQNKKPRYNYKFKNLKKIAKKFKTVICVTSNETRKNLNFLYKIIKNSKNINFIIVGNINNKIFLNNVYYFKNISEENLVYLFKISNVLLDVSLFEGFGRSSVEAQYFKLKVICFNTKINREILRNSATFIKKNTEMTKILDYIKLKSSSTQKLKFFRNANRYSSKNVYQNFKKEICEI